MDVRCVVVGEDDGGVTTVWFDGPSSHAHTRPGYPSSLELVDLWYTDDLVTLVTVAVAPAR